MKLPINIKSLINYLGTFPKVFSENSTKLLALLLSAIAGFFLAAVIIPFVLIYDVITNGYVRTDLGDLGVFILCIGGFLAGAGVNVKVPNFNKKSHDDNDEEGETTPKSL